MDLAHARTLLAEGRYEDAERVAVGLAGEDGSVELLAEALLLAAEGAAKQGNTDRAAEYLQRAVETAPADSEIADRAWLNLGKIHLRRHEVSAAEQFFLEALVRYPADTLMATHAVYGLAQVYEAQRRWDVSAATYGQAADGYVRAGLRERALRARQNQVWAHVMAGKLDNAEAALALCESSLDAANERQRHILQAVRAYHRFLTGAGTEAANRTAELITNVGPSAWANCLAAVTAGWIAHYAGMATETQKALRFAESVMLQASHETGSTDIINLVNELRSTAA